MRNPYELDFLKISKKDKDKFDHIVDFWYDGHEKYKGQKSPEWNRDEKPESWPNHWLVGNQFID